MLKAVGTYDQTAEAILNIWSDSDCFLYFFYTFFLLNSFCLYFFLYIINKFFMINKSFWLLRFINQENSRVVVLLAKKKTVKRINEWLRNVTSEVWQDYTRIQSNHSILNISLVFHLKQVSL